MNLSKAEEALEDILCILYANKGSITLLDTLPVSKIVEKSFRVKINDLTTIINKVNYRL